MDTTNGGWSDWFDRINTAALTWYGVYAQNQPAPVGTTANPSASIGTTGSGVQASVSLPVLIVGAVVIIGAIYVYKKA
jgi:hypothetical protein